jgi:cytochrome c oxidase assembly protein subunit 15
VSVPQRTVHSAFVLVALTWMLLVFGSTVRVHGAGLACPDWPLCFGEVIPQIDFSVGLEFGHRVVAGGVSLLFLAMIAHLRHIGVWAASRAVRTVIIAASVALLVQVILGGLTVLELLAEWTVASHLLTGNTFCSLLLLLALTLAEERGAPVRTAAPAWSRWVATATAALVPLQIALGGLVAGSHAGLACGTWPSCNGVDWFPTFEGLVGLQVMHRAMAYALLLAALVNALAQRGAARRPAWLLLGVVCAQATLGVLNVMLRLPVEVTLLHSAGAAASLLTTTWLLSESWRAPVVSASRASLAPAEAK